MGIAMFDRVRQLEGRGHHEGWTTAPAGAHRPPILLGKHGGVAAPAIAAPAQRPLPRPGCRQADGSSHPLLTDAPGRMGDDEAAGAVHDQTPPALPIWAGLVPFVWRSAQSLLVAGGAFGRHGGVLLRTKDQNSSISTVESCRSRTSTLLRASAWRAARRSHWPIVSYLWPVISSAARRLPRRITISNACAISATGVRSR